MLTLALGVGATTAIFRLIHTVMLKLLPMVDPSSPYRIGDGNECCVEGSPQDNWGMFSYPFYQRMKKVTPEFSELAAFQAGTGQYAVRRGDSDRIPKPLRGEMVRGEGLFTLHRVRHWPSITVPGTRRCWEGRVPSTAHQSRSSGGSASLLRGRAPRSGSRRAARSV